MNVIDTLTCNDLEAQLKDQMNRLKILNELLVKGIEEEICKNREKDMLAMQQDRFASIGQLAAGVAHEINSAGAAAG